MPSPISNVKPVLQNSFSNVKPSVLIVGAGPAGLIRAILSVKSGYSTKVIESRSENDKGRDNVIALQEDAIEILKEHGVYDLLIQEKAVFPPSRQLGLSVRLNDLERALKTVLASLTDKPLISFESEVIKIIERKNENAEVIIKRKDGSLERCRPDVLVIADGSHSQTQKLLGISRVEVLPPVPVVAAIFKDNRPKIVSVSTFFKYVGITILNSVTKIYYFTLFLFKMIFQKENMFNPGRKIVGGIILASPKQNYLGFCLNEKESENLVHLHEEVKKAEIKLQEAERKKLEAEIDRAKQGLMKAEKRRDRHLKHWAYLSFFFANTMRFFACVVDFFRCHKDREWLVVKWKPFSCQNTHVIKIGADKADKSCGMVGKSLYLIAGDALATVDPVTARGGRTAIVSSLLFSYVMNGLEKKEPAETLLSDYDHLSQTIVLENHRESIKMRSLYRPRSVI